MEKPKVEYAARTAFHEERSASIIPAHIAAELERMNAETRSSDEDEEDLPVVPRVLRYRL
jgi:hypothetical protein